MSLLVLSLSCVERISDGEAEDKLWIRRQMKQEESLNLT